MNLSENSELFKMGLAQGVANTIQEIVDIVNESELYPEYLEENILDWLESKVVV